MSAKYLLINELTFQKLAMNVIVIITNISSFKGTEVFHRPYFSVILCMPDHILLTIDLFIHLFFKPTNMANVTTMYIWNLR